MPAETFAHIEKSPGGHIPAFPGISLWIILGMHCFEYSLKLFVKGNLTEHNASILYRHLGNQYLTALHSILMAVIK